MKNNKITNLGNIILQKCIKINNQLDEDIKMLKNKNKNETDENILKTLEDYDRKFETYLKNIKDEYENFNEETFEIKKQEHEKNKNDFLKYINEVLVQKKPDNRKISILRDKILDYITKIGNIIYAIEIKYGKIHEINKLQNTKKRLSEEKKKLKESLKNIKQKSHKLENSSQNEIIVNEIIDNSAEQMNKNKIEELKPTNDNIEKSQNSIKNFDEIKKQHDEILKNIREKSDALKKISKQNKNTIEEFEKTTNNNIEKSKDFKNKLDELNEESKKYKDLFKDMPDKVVKKILKEYYEKFENYINIFNNYLKNFNKNAYETNKQEYKKYKVDFTKYINLNITEKLKNEKIENLRSKIINNIMDIDNFIENIEKKYKNLNSENTIEKYVEDYQEMYPNEKLKNMIKEINKNKNTLREKFKNEHYKLYEFLFNVPNENNIKENQNKINHNQNKYEDIAKKLIYDKFFHTRYLDKYYAYVNYFTLNEKIKNKEFKEEIKDMHHNREINDICFKEQKNYINYVKYIKNICRNFDKIKYQEERRKYDAKKQEFYEYLHENLNKKTIKNEKHDFLEYICDSIYNEDKIKEEQNKMLLNQIEEIFNIINTADITNKIIDENIIEQYNKDNINFYNPTYNEYRQIFGRYIEIFEQIFRSSCLNINDSTFAYDELDILKDIQKDYEKEKSSYKKLINSDKNINENFKMILFIADQIENIEFYIKKATKNLKKY